MVVERGARGLIAVKTPCGGELHGGDKTADVREVRSQKGRCDAWRVSHVEMIDGGREVRARRA